MAFTFSTEALQRPLADFGNDAAAMILQTGQTIQQGLQQMMTNRQVAGLGQELGTINPESPDWAQQAIKLGSRYPLAMKSPAGQFMLSTQAKAHAEWSQTQRATQQSNLTFQRQREMEGLRTQNDIKLEGIRHQNRMAAAGNEMMDLTVPPAINQQGMGVGFGTDETQFQDQENLPGATQVQPPTSLRSGSPSVPLFGATDDLTALSPGARVKQSLVNEGVTKIPAKEFRSAVAAERRADASRVMQEDRQKEAVKMAEIKAEKDAAKAAESEKRSLRGMDAVGIRQQRTNVNSQLMAAKRKLESDFDEEMEVVNAEKPLSKEQTLYFRRRKALSDEIQALTADYAELTKQLEALGGSEENVSRRKYDPATRSLR
jgi:hypothetical protein